MLDRCLPHAGLLRVAMVADKTLPILIVDDHRDIVRLLHSILERIGLPYIEDAPNGELALTKLRERPHSLVISDWIMEPMDGLELLKEVRRDADLSTTPFIMITASREEGRVVAAKRAGVTGYIVKPFSIQSVKDKLAHVFGEL